MQTCSSNQGRKQLKARAGIQKNKANTVKPSSVRDYSHVASFPASAKSLKGHSQSGHPDLMHKVMHGRCALEPLLFPAKRKTFLDVLDYARADTPFLYAASLIHECAMLMVMLVVCSSRPQLQQEFCAQAQRLILCSSPTPIMCMKQVLLGM